MLAAVEEIFSAANIAFLLRGAGWSLVVATAATLIGIALGVIAAAGKISRRRVPRVIANIYIELIRGTPMLLQLSFLYLGIPMIYKGLTGSFLNADPLMMGIVAIGINSGAYCAELIRAAINSIDRGQWEAGESLGLAHRQVMRKIILPQALKRIVPPLANEYITLIKDSSLVSTIGVIELMKSSTIIGARYYNYFLPLLGAALVYLVLTLAVSRAAAALERRMAVSD